MDGFSSYNHILIAVEDIPKTAFRCPGPIGTFEWLVMPFGIKNASATYQREMKVIFHDMLGHHMEVYIDDIVVKFRRAGELKPNPLKCAFGVRTRNFLEFLVHQKGMKVNQNKAKAIASANAPQNKKELQKFLG